MNNDIVITKCSAFANTLPRLRKVEYIVIHKGTHTARENAVSFANPTTHYSTDFAIDKDGIIQYNPDVSHRVCCHIHPYYGDLYIGTMKIGISNSIAIQICNNVDSIFDDDKTLNNTAELTAYIANQYNIPENNIIYLQLKNNRLCSTAINFETNEEWRVFNQKLIELRKI